MLGGLNYIKFLWLYRFGSDKLSVYFIEAEFIFIKNSVSLIYFDFGMNFFCKWPTA